MGAYARIDENISDILDKIISNETIQKILYFDDPNALKKDLPLNFDKFSLYNSSVWDIPKIPEPENEQKTLLLMYLKKADKAGSNNVYQYDMTIEINVMSHIDTWKLEEGLKRPYIMCDIIDNIVQNAKTKSINGVWKIDRPCNLTWFNTRFIGYQMTAYVTNPSNNCG